MGLRVTLLLLPLLALGLASAQTDPPAPPSKEPSELSFTRDVGPILEKYCTSCHNSTKKSADLILDSFKDDAGAAKDQKTWEKVLRMVRSGEMPPSNRKQPTLEERNRVLDWIDVQVFAVDCTKAKDPGRVTIRRLNRSEYNNTIRDLVGVQFRPAEDFPADDVGYGFDNIGDVLSMSPILMEKYLAAAEKVVEQAIVVEDHSAASVQRFSARNLDSTVGSVVRGDARIFSSNGEAYLDHTFPQDGEYIVRARAWATPAGDEPARLAFRIDDEDLAETRVKAVESDPGFYQTRLAFEAGKHRVSFAFVNEYRTRGGQGRRREERQLTLQTLEIVGPVPPRSEPLPETHKRIFFREPTAETKEECAHAIIERFGGRAYRRPMTTAEVERLVRFVELAETQGESFERGIQLAVQAILVSPHFLFRIEEDQLTDPPGGVYSIGEFELATRLSYFLWSSMPDAELFALAEKGELRANLDAQVRRMTKDPKAKALVENFAGQWLQLRNLKTATPEPMLFPSFDDELRNAMLTETEMFFEAMLREDRSIVSFLDADFTFLNERLAKHYGISGVQGTEFRRVQLTGDQRGGVLTHASILTLTSNPTRTSPVKRGKWILENILGTPPPPPPPDAGELSEDEEIVLKGSLRQRMEQHRANPTCASCHQRMDPLGFGFENYDGVGAWRTKDGKFAIDPAGELPSGKSFKGPAELKVILKEQKDAFARCLAEKMLVYSLGRGVEYYDKCALDEIARSMTHNEYRLSSLILAIVKSDPFQKRRGKRELP